MEANHVLRWHGKGRQGLLERDTENNYLALDAVSENPMAQLLDYSITYRIALGSQAGRKI